MYPNVFSTISQSLGNNTTMVLERKLSVKIKAGKEKGK